MYAVSSIFMIEYKTSSFDLSVLIFFPFSRVLIFAHYPFARNIWTNFRAFLDFCAKMREN